MRGERGWLEAQKFFFDCRDLREGYTRLMEPSRNGPPRFREI